MKVMEKMEDAYEKKDEAYFVKVLKATKAAVVYENTPALSPGVDAFKKQMQALGGTVVYSKAIDGQATDFSNEALGLKQAGATAVWLQGGALACYLLAAVTAMASERGALSANIHRPFSLLTQLAIALALVHIWGRGHRPLVLLNMAALAAILADTALHYLLTR